ncbi:MAG: hydrogenase nickel incorporation protein HypA [Spirochaetia bacterium]
MHEWALAEAVVETILKEIEGRKVRSVDSVALSLGTLQNVDKTVFREGLRNFLPSDIPLTKERFIFTEEAAEFLCRRCGAKWAYSREDALDEDDRESIHFLPEAAHSYLSCPSCGSPDFEITKGRGVSISSIEITEED